MSKTSMAPGCKAMAQRMVQAEEDFLRVLMSRGGLGRDDAERVLACYLKVRVVTMDAVIGRMDVRHGAFLDRDVIRRALEAA